MPDIITSSDDPPKLINGSGAPVAGSTAVITAMLSKALAATQMVSPLASKAPKPSGAPTSRK